MTSEGLPATRVEEVAALLENDMRQRGLRPGDKYLTAAEAGEILSVSSMTIHRAMQSLAGRELLIRQRSRGTFVGPKFRASNHQGQEINVVHLLVAMDYHLTQNFSSDQLVDEFTKTIPGVSVQVHHVMQRAALRYTNELIQRIDQAPREAMVLIRCSREVQQAVFESGFPAVVFGQAYPGLDLRCVKHDQEAVGRLMAQYAIDRTAERFALLTHSRWRMGDHLMFDSATAMLADAGVRLDALKVRCVTPDREAIEDTIRDIWDGPEPVDVFLCRSDFHAQIVHELKPSFESKMGKPIHVVSGGHSPPGGTAPFARVVSTKTLAEQVELLSQLLITAVNTEHDAERRTTIIPVEFCRPSSGVS